MAQTHVFDDNHIDRDLPIVFKAIKDFSRRPENPFHIESDFIDARGFTIDLSRGSSFVSGEFRCKIHISGYPDENIETPGCTLSFSVQSSEKEVDDVKEATCNRILRGIQRELEGKTVEQMLAESTQGSISAKELIGEGKEKRNFIIAIVAIIVALAIMLPSGLAQGCML